MRDRSTSLHDPYMASAIVGYMQIIVSLHELSIIIVGSVLSAYIIRLTIIYGIT